MEPGESQVTWDGDGVFLPRGIRHWRGAGCSFYAQALLGGGELFSVGVVLHVSSGGDGGWASVSGPPTLPDRL